MGGILLLALGALVVYWVQAVQAFGREFDDTSGVTVTYSAGLLALAHAIEVAEGSNPAYHNPGDIKIPGWTGPTFGVEQIPALPDRQTGLGYLYRQLSLIETGRSHVYTRTMTILDMAKHWTDTDGAAWAHNVASVLGVPVTTTLDEVFG